MTESAAGRRRPRSTAVDHRSSSELAIVSLVTAFAIPPLGLVLAVISLVRLRSGGCRGRGPALTAAVAAVVLGAVLIAAAIVVQRGGVVLLGGRSGGFGWYGYSPLSSG